MISQRRLRVAIIDEELPYPATSGKRIRTLNLLIRLAERHQLSLLCHRNSDAQESRDAMAFFADHNIETVVAERSPPPKSALQTGPTFYARLAANLFSPLPYLVTANCSVELRRLIKSHLAIRPVDLWHCEWTPYCQLTEGLPTDPLVVAAHNVESTIWRRYYETETHPAKRWYIKHQWRKLMDFERRAFARAERVIAVSDCDAARIRDEFGASHVDVVDNGVDTDYFLPTCETRDAHSILFLGSLDWRPNLDAVNLLLEQIFPLVRRVVPAARLVIVGRNPPAWLRHAVMRAENVDLHSDVPDVRPFLNRCGAMAVPLRIGGGSRLKILEALACGMPVVSTTIGAEGLLLDKELHYFEGNTPDELAVQLVRSIELPQIAIERAARGRQLVLERYGWDGLADKLDKVWQGAVPPCSAARMSA